MSRGVSAVQRTKAVLKGWGITHDMVERRFPPRPGAPYGTTKDFLNIIDILALTDEGVLGIQVCGSDFASHVIKMLDEYKDNTIEWLLTPGTSLEIWSWRKILKQRGGKAKVWKPRIVPIVMHFGGPVLDEEKTT